MGKFIHIDLVGDGDYEKKFGFETKVMSKTIVQGLSERTVFLISRKKKEPNFILQWRLQAYKSWVTLLEPKWSGLYYKLINFGNIVYYSAPNFLKRDDLYATENVNLLDMYKRLNINLTKRKKLGGIAIDAVFDSVSVVTTFKKQLYMLGIIFSSFSDAIKNFPTLVGKYLGTVVLYSDNFYTMLNSAIFSDGSFCYIPIGVKCPIELSTYFRINTVLIGQFERTLLIADKYSYVSYLEGCTATKRDENQLHAAVVELLALDNSEIKYSTVQNWYQGDYTGKGGVLNFVTKRGHCIGNYSKITWIQIEAGSSCTWKYPSVVLKGTCSVGEFYSVAFTNNKQQTDTGSKMIHIGSNTISSIFSKSVLSGYSTNIYRGLVEITENCFGGTNYTQCDSLLLEDTCTSETYPELSVTGKGNYATHEALTGKISYIKLLYCLQRGLSTKDATVLIIGGFCSNVLKKLPTEFSIEIQNLIEKHFERLEYGK